jgi:hypothetical protein
MSRGIRMVIAFAILAAVVSHAATRKRGNAKIEIEFGLAN